MVHVVGIVYALDVVMKAKNLEDVVVYREAVDAALLERPSFRKDFDFVDQLSRSTSRRGPLIAERFGQLTDRHLAVYLGLARGSALETFSTSGVVIGKTAVNLIDHGPSTIRRLSVVVIPARPFA